MTVCQREGLPHAAGVRRMAITHSSTLHCLRAGGSHRSPAGAQTLTVEPITVRSHMSFLHMDNRSNYISSSPSRPKDVHTDWNMRNTPSSRTSHGVVREIKDEVTTQGCQNHDFRLPCFIHISKETSKSLEKRAHTLPQETVKPCRCIPSVPHVLVPCMARITQFQV